MTKEIHDALDLALEALKKLYGVLTIEEIEPVDKAITAIKQARSAPVQEPAFHGFMDKENCCVHICYTPWAPRMTDGKFATAYYTTPPAAQRQSARSAWVGLTDEDKLHIEIMGGKSDVMLAEMVEAKLKERNV
jgi:hypothetical protein